MTTPVTDDGRGGAAPPNTSSPTPWRALLSWFDASAGTRGAATTARDGVDWARIVPFVGMHAACLAVFWVGISAIAVGVAVALYLLRMFAITGFYHRYFSHRTFKTSRLAQFVFAALGASAVQRGPIWWAAHHRHHHAHSDQPDDAHWPSQRGFLWSHMGWFLSHRHFAPDLGRVRDLLRFLELRWLDRFDILVAFLLALGLLLAGRWLEASHPELGATGGPLLVWGFCVSTVACHHGTYTINSLCHVWGRRRYATGDDGRHAAWRLSREHEVTLYEANDCAGGHTASVDVEWDGRRYGVDTGFIVFNDWTYPHFIAMLRELGVAWQPSNMSFSLSCERTGLEYNGTSLNSLFVQRRNALRPSFLRMIADILRCNSRSRSLAGSLDPALTLGAYLEQGNFSRQFVEHYVVPMGRAIWSAEASTMLGFPARFFVEFFDRHGFLSVDDRPVWQAVTGGSREYVRALLRVAKLDLRLSTPVDSVRRLPNEVRLRTARGDVAAYDHVFLACHSVQALAMLEAPSAAETEVLAAFPYAANEVTLHTDASVLPKRPLARAAWNYHLLADPQEPVALTYDMNVLQSLDAPVRFLVSLNHARAIDERKVLRTFTYDHPVYSPRAVQAQARHRELNGAQRTYFCGAYWRCGFHEDGAVSAQAALAHFDEDLASAELPVRRVGLASARRAGAARLPLSPLPAVPRPARGARGSRGPLVLVGAAACARPLAPGRPPGRPGPQPRYRGARSRREPYGAAPRGADPPADRAAPARLRLQPGQLLLLLRRGGPRARGGRRRGQQHALGRAALLRAAPQPQRGHCVEAALPLRQGLPRLAVPAHGHALRLALQPAGRPAAGAHGELA